MNQKTNKIIAISGFVIIALILFLGLSQYFYNPKYVNQRLISQCETNLDKPTQAGNIPSQRICKIENNKIAILETSGEMSSKVKPEDTIIISVNLGKILNGQLQNVYTGQEITKPQDNQGVFCFVIYPILLKKNMVSYNEEIYNSFYSQYLWEIYPKNILNLFSKGDNYICTKLYPLNDYQKISALIKIPSQKDLNLGYGETKSYGLKVVMAPENLKNLQLNDKDVIDNYKDFLPLYHLIKFINFKE